MAECIPLKALYSGSTPTALGEFTEDDIIDRSCLPLSDDALMLEDSDALIPTQRAVRAYVESKANFPLRVIGMLEEVVVGERREYAILSGILTVYGAINLEEDAVLFVGTGIN